MSLQLKQIELFEKNTYHMLVHLMHKEVLRKYTLIFGSIASKCFIS